MSRLTKAKKLAKRQARKMAKRHSEPPKNAKGKPGFKKLTGQRAAAGQWQEGLRNMPVAFVKASVEENCGPPENLLEVISSDDGSESEQDALAAVEGDLDSWLDQELQEDRQNEAECDKNGELVEPIDESREHSAADGAEADRMADEPDADALPADATMALRIDDSASDSASDSSIDIQIESRLAAETDELSMRDNEMESSLAAPYSQSEASAVESSGSDLDSDLDGDSSDVDVSSEDEPHISFDDVEPEDAIQQDYIDNVSDLDDDEIFALANNLQRNEDYDIFDNSNVDDYFTELIASGVDKKKERHQMKDLRRAAKRGALQLLWMKYPESISITEVIDELTTYIKLRRMEPKPLVFPPLDHNANWYVKQFADYFNLTAKIQGSRESKSVVVTLTNGSHARPLTGKIVSFTKRRQNFRRQDAGANAPEFAAAMQYVVTEVLDNRAYTWDRQKLADRVTDELISGRVPDFVMGSAAAAAKQKPQKGAGKPSSRVKDGHIVGQNASEIHTENFGHRLLRQMGWEHGSGLGKERAGIVAPIPATVKLTRGGLGK